VYEKTLLVFRCINCRFLLSQRNSLKIYLQQEGIAYIAIRHVPAQFLIIPLAALYCHFLTVRLKSFLPFALNQPTSLRKRLKA